MKYLGVHIDPHLNFQAQIRATEQENFKIYWHYFKTEFQIPTSALLKLYYAFVHPHLLNGHIVWRFSYATYLKIFSVFQNKAVLLQEGGAYRDHVTLFYSALKTFKLHDLFKHKVAKTVFRHFQNNLPP